MKKQKFLLGAAGLLALGLTACSNETLVENEVVQKDQTRYMRVAICNPGSSGTRAEEFADGTTDESAVKSMYFKFFDRQGLPVATVTPSNITFTNVTPAKGEAAGNIDAYKEAIVEVELINGSGLPAYVLCFINPTNWNDIKSNTIKMEDFRTKTRPGYGNATNGFAMTNSVYYGTDKVTQATDVKISGTPIAYTQLFTSREDAAAATGQEIVNIYVERYASKVQFTISNDAIKDQTVDDYTFTFVPEAWTINADAPSMYVVKRYDDDDADTDVIASKESVDAMLSGWTTWNSPTYRRSYWACSPGYYAQNFPEVSDQIADYYREQGLTDANTPNGAGWVSTAEGAPNALRYYSYNQVTATSGNGAGVRSFAANGATLPSKYVLENTMSKLAFESKNPKAAAPSVLVVGTYTIKNGENALPAGTEFYLKDDVVYFANADVENAKEDAQTIFDKFVDDNQILYLKVTENEPVLDEEGNPKKDEEDNDITVPVEKYVEVGLDSPQAVLSLFEVKHPDHAVRGTAVLAHRYVTLQLNGTVDNLYYSPNGTDEYIQVTTANLNGVNSLLWNQIGVAEKFNAGHGYFSIPIKHLGWYEREGAKPENADGEIEWENVQVGDFGLVRNHIYNLQVTEINDMATGIESLNYPIVPPADISSYFIKYRLNILNWRVVDTQNVTIK